MNLRDSDIANSAGGVWDNEQRIRFRKDWHVLDAAWRKHALQQLVAGINSGVIKVHGWPLF
jgi:hypothetical protein